ncbi:HpcH/HpaI aldolase/citrate lyase family protein [uncultured Sphingomonas sp.]|uniref:HpcH/HpaI aldolase/citrate lyase family protein n=1 Tax=uncultured Sphingomonas sp. TaxID=158754 RepID=UPI0035C99C99
MRLRSLLFVPGDRPDRFAKAAAAGADTLILDLEDSVAVDRKAFAREAIVSCLIGSWDGPPRFVRINPLEGDLCDADIAALANTRPDAIVLPKAEGAASVHMLVTRLAAVGLGGVPILPIATETPRAIFALGSFAEVGPSLAGLTWGAEDLPAAIGAATSREADGRYTAPYELARSLTLFAAHAADVAAIETVFPAFRDLEGLTAYAARAARDGYTGMMAIHPAQVSVINRAFSPSEAALTHARRVIAAFEASPGVGAIQLDGVMIDAPHLKQARHLVGLADPG